MKKVFQFKFAFYFAFFCSSILAICYFYGIFKGFNSRITAGFELDAANLSVALSRIWFGLYKGYVGYRDIYNALFQILVPDNNPNNPNNFALLSNFDAIQYAFQNVKAIIPASLPNYSIFSSDFISINMEDVGLADFYTLAFWIFGVKPTAMYNFYFLLMGLSVSLFFIEYRKQILPLLLLSMLLSILPVFFFSDFFTFLIPSVNANRFLSTLGFVPILHALCINFKSDQKLNKKQIGILFLQALLFSFAISIRKSGQWQIIGLSLFTSFIALKLLWPIRKSLFSLENLRILTHPVLFSTLIFIFTMIGYQSIQKAMLNPVYKTDCSPSHHAIWHSAYLGLGLHPDWVKLNISNNNGQAFGPGDANGWHTFEKYMRDRGLDPVCHITNNYMFGLHEIVMKQEFLRFVKHHKKFALKLYAYYKPKQLLATFIVRAKSISKIYLLSTLVFSIFVGFLLTFISQKEKIKPITSILTASIFLLASWLPPFFAYAIPYAADDFWMLGFYLCLLVSLITYFFLENIKRRMYG